ncbi:DNA polymerase domain-containing protein [Halorutilales archaeon Cl-col2-1]
MGDGNQSSIRDFGEEPENPGTETETEGTEIGVTNIDYTVESDADGEPYPVVNVFGRTRDREARHVRVLGFEPYFYVPEDQAEGIDEKEERVTRTEDGYESIEGDDLVRVYTRIPADVGEVRESYHHYEADILFPNRFRIDKGVKSGIRIPPEYDGDEVIEIDESEVEPCDVNAPARTGIIDIEVEDRHGFPENGEESIICLTAWDSFEDEYDVFVFDADAPDEVDGARVHSYETEEEMLDEFLSYVEEKDFDLFSGWNFNDFDAPYLIDRLDVLDLDSARLSRLNEVWHSDWGGPTVKGRTTFDLLYAYQRMKFTELESYRLDAIAEEELGESKVHYTGKIGDLWHDDTERLLEYNKIDVELCVRIDEKVDIIDFFRELSRFVGCSLEDSTTPSDVVDIYVLRKAHGEFVLPSKGGGSGEEYAGGEVFEPITGIRENVAVLDLACFTGDTEVVTPDGVVDIKRMSEGDEVYTLNPETFEVEVEEIIETHEYDNKYGEIHHVSGNTHDFKVTENHRFLVSNERGWDSQSPEDFDFMEYRDVPGSDRFAFPNHEAVEGETRDVFELWRDAEEGYVALYSDRDLRSVRHDLPDEVCDSVELIHGSSGRLKLEKTGKYLVPLETYRKHREAVETAADEVVLKRGRQHRGVPTEFDFDDWLRLIGWYVTEGSARRKDDEGVHRVTLHQKGDERDEIRDLLDRMSLNYSVDSRGFNLSNRTLHDWLTQNCGSGSENKRLPDFVFDLDSSHLNILLETLVKGDGTPSERTGNVDKFWTASDRLKDDVVRLGVRCGHKPTVKKQTDGTWYVSFGKRGSFNKSVNASVEEHDGKVYCVTAENNHVVLAGREGKFQWVGQSLYPMSMVSINASPETKAGDEYDGDTYEAPNGVEFRKDIEGLTKTIVTELLEERQKKKDARDEHEYGSPEYNKFDNQQSAIKVVMNCFSGDTDVVTEDGVRNIKDIETGEYVYSVDPETKQVEFKEVVETYEYDYSGEMVDIETRHTDFSVTPNHKMLVETESGTEFVEAGDLNDYTNYQIPTGDPIDGEKPEKFSLLEEGKAENVFIYADGHGTSFKKSIGEASKKLEYESNRKAYRCSLGHIRENPVVADEADEILLQRGARQSTVPHEFDIEDWLRLVGWYVTEGSVYEIKQIEDLRTRRESLIHEIHPKEYETTKRGRSKKIQFAQIDGDGRDSIRSLLERMGMNPLSEERQISVTNAVIADWLVENCGSGSENKRLPDFVFSLDSSLLEVLFDTLIQGDGDTHSGIRYSTKSDRLKDDMVRLAVHLGYKPMVSRDSGVWRIRFSRNKGSFRMHRNGSISRSQDGKVYCVTVEDNHTVLAGRDGKFQWVGQSYYGVAGYPRFRLYDREMGSAVTATGRRVIEHTRDTIQEMGYDVIYGDTDSTLVELGSDREFDEIIETGEVIEEKVNESYDDLARDEFNASADTHRWEIEFEKLYRRFFQAGKKKRYAGHLTWNEGKEVDEIDITGFEYKRSDVAQVTKDVQEEVIRRIVTGEEFDSVAEYLRDVIDEFKEGDFSYDYIGIPGGIGQKLDAYDTDTAQVKGAKYANENLGTNFTSGSKPKRLYIKRVKPSDDGQQYPPTDVVCFEYEEQIPDEFVVDWDKMLQKTLEEPISRILEALDWSWSEVESGQEQTGLGEF